MYVTAHVPPVSRNVQTPYRPTVENCKKIEVSEENRAFNAKWIASFDITADETG